MHRDSNSLNSFFTGIFLPLIELSKCPEKFPDIISKQFRFFHRSKMASPKAFLSSAECCNPVRYIASAEKDLPSENALYHRELL
jgi:hypothetical protein